MTITTKKFIKIAVYGRYIPFFILLIVLGSCNFGTPDFRLNVIIEEGVTGTPQAGEHLHQDLSEIDFEYVGIDPVHTVEVFLNQIRQTYTGTFTMYTDVTLIARLVDIRGSWRVTLTQSDPVETIVFDITLNGAGLTNGSFSDNRGYNGNWTAENGVVTITYADWDSAILEGAVYNMSGIYTINTVDGDKGGGWSTERLS
jgi:hypothetical protein